MIKEIKINSGKNVVSNVCDQEGVVSQDLIMLISTLEKCVGQYCLVIDIMENNSYLERKQRAYDLSQMLNDLTKRELEVLRLAIKGFSNKEISDCLSISLETVKSHRKKIVSKVGIRKVNDLKDIMLRANLAKVI